jgi:glycosyltransferase involved in cell wall biosynthesis
MHTVFPEYDALVHPSFIEGLPNAICEALACGLPILAGDVCDHALLVEHNVNGYLFDPGLSESIAESLVAFAELSPGSRQRMGIASRRLAEEKLGVNRLVDEYETLAMQLTAQPRAGTSAMDA